jgi:hypothetical protein
MNSTEKYIDENEKVLSLHREAMVCDSARKNVGWSLSGLLLKNIKMILSSVKHYPIAVWKGRKFFLKTITIKGTKKEKRALIIGNGPSQGMLSSTYLENFVKSGNEIFCVNNWHLNEDLRECVPTWMVFSDPYTFSEKNSKAIGLIDYIRARPAINLVIPSIWVEAVSRMGFINSIYTFVDVELTFSGNINPLLPRGYISMTLYKALAWALHLGYKEIGVIGMDNTYVRNMYCDKDNRMLNLETHAGIDDYVCDQSAFYPTIACALEDIYRLFKDLECFPESGVVNLDSYSLTDRFVKTNPNDFFGIKNVY